MNNKIAISKNFIISIMLLCFMICTFASSIDEVTAVDANQSVEDYGINAIDEDKLENSQNNEVLKANEKVLTGGTYGSIQNVILYELDVDTVVLNGKFYAENDHSYIFVNRNMTITSTSQGVLDGKQLSTAFIVEETGSGSSFSNLKFVNGMGFNGGAALVQGSDVTFYNCVFEGNTATNGGGAIYTEYYIENNPERSKNLVIDNCNFIKNSARIAAGAVGIYGINSKVVNCRFDSNWVYDEQGTVEVYGGAIQIGKNGIKSNWLVKECTFTNNKAISANGKISHAGAGCVRDGTTYENCVFENNSADMGGALYYHASGNVVNCEFIGNIANLYGGALSTDWLGEYGELLINECTFEDNSAPLGGAAQLFGESIRVKNSNFTNNYASKDGGAIAMEADKITVEYSNFNENTANRDGGALFLNGKNIEIKRNTFEYNQAIPDVNKLDDGLGGAIYVNASKVSVENNIFGYNTARNGSAVYFDKIGRDLSLTNNQMYQNQAWVYLLPVYATDIEYGEVEKFGSIIYGGNNIGDFDNLAVSNAIYNAAGFNYLKVNGETPVSGATNSGRLYQDSREYNIPILLTVKHDDGTVVYKDTLNSNYLGEVSNYLANLKPGKYFVTATHNEDNYYKFITNTTTFTVSPKIDVAIEKSSNDKYNYHDLVVWTLNVVNNGPNNATGVNVSDVLPDGLIWKSDNSNGKYNPNTGVWNIGSLTIGKSVQIKIVTLINKTGSITNKASVSANEKDINLANNNAQESINVAEASDLSIVKSVNNTTPNYGDLVKWTIIIKNNGPDVAHDIFVKDILPESLVYVSSTGNYDNYNGMWSVGSLAVGSSTRLEITTRVDATGEIINYASVSAKEHDYDMSNNNDSQKIIVASASDLSISKIVNNTIPNFNNLVKWTITVTNKGIDKATGVSVSDNLPNGLNFVSADDGYSDGVWTVGNLNVGESKTLNIVCKVTKTGKITNMASVKGNEYDIDLTNNRASQSIDVAQASDLSIVKSVNDSNPNYGDLVKWTLVVSNNGPDIAHDVKVQDKIPDSLIIVGSVKNYNSKTGIWTIGTLNVGASASLSITTIVNKTGEIINFANVSAEEYDYNPSNNNVSKNIITPQASDLTIIKTVNKTSPNYGDLVKWTLTVVNNGPDSATGVSVSDVLDDGLEFVSADDGYSDGVWTVGNLNVGESKTLNIVCRVNKTGKIVNLANVSGREYDINLSNNNDSCFIDVPPASDLAVEKSVSNSTPNFGDWINWTIIVTNKGPDTAHNITVCDLLPEYLIWIESTGNYNPNTGIWKIDSLDVDKSSSLTITTLVNKTGEIINTVNVTADEYDIDSSNNNASKSIEVPPASDLSITKTVNKTNPNYLDLVKWTLTVVNNGPDSATGVNVSDVLDDGLEFVSADGSYSNGVWTVGNLNVGESKSLNIICKVIRTGEISNTANVSGIEYGINLENNIDCESIIVPPAADLKVVKVVNNTQPNYKDIIKWTITVRNNGPDNGTGVNVSDILPDGIYFQSYTSTKGDYSNGIWNIGNLNAGESERLEIISSVLKTGDFTNIAIANGNEYDYDLTNNEDSQKISVHSASDLSIRKFVNETNPKYKDIIKWTLIVTNNGPDMATGVEVIDLLPDGLTLVESTDSSYYNQIWHVGTLNSGEVKEFSIICRVDKTGKFTNEAVVTAHQYDYDSSNNHDEVSIKVDLAADLAITKTVSKYVYDMGDVIEYSIEVKNNGPNKANNIVVSELLGDNLEFYSFELSAGSFDVENQVWNIESLDYGDVALLNLKTIASDAGKAINKVSVASDTYDYNLDNNVDSVIVDILENTYDKLNGIAKTINKSNIDGLKEITKSIVGMAPTGNPILLLLLISIGFIFVNNMLKFKRKR